MKKFETLVFDQWDADEVGGVEELQRQYEKVGFRLVEIDPETLGKLYTDPEDGTIVLIMDREVPVPVNTPRPTVVRPVDRARKPWQPLILEENLPSQTVEGHANAEAPHSSSQQETTTPIRQRPYFQIREEGDDNNV